MIRAAKLTGIQYLLSCKGGEEKGKQDGEGNSPSAYVYEWPVFHHALYSLITLHIRKGPQCSIKWRVLLDEFARH